MLPKGVAPSSTRDTDAHDFSVVLGGPLFRAYRLTHLSGEALELATRRVVVVSLFAWVPLLVLSAFEGSAWSGVKEPFLRDPDVQARLLIALPMMIAGELLVHRRMSLAAREFLRRGLVTDAGRPRFEAAIASALRLRNSSLAEFLLLALVYLLGITVIWHSVSALDIDSWYRHPDGDAYHVTIAGWWYRLVSLPLFQFILYRWYLRLGVWAWLLWKVVRTGLDLLPTHPDRCGGLGFLGESTYALVPLLAAHGTLFAGVAASGIAFEGRTLAEYWPGVILLATLVFLIALGPLLVFVPTLLRTKINGLQEYGLLAQHYVHDFDRKWVHDNAVAAEPLLGTSDLQSLADLGNSYQVIAGMGLMPITRETLVRLAGATLVPLVPLVLSLFSVRELLTLVLKGLG
jgi:hypothetical protein